MLFFTPYIVTANAAPYPFASPKQLALLPRWRGESSFCACKRETGHGAPTPRGLLRQRGTLSLHMQAYGEDLRGIVLSRVRDGESQEAVASFLGVHRNTVGKYLRKGRALFPSRERAEEAVRRLGFDGKVEVGNVDEEGEGGASERARARRLGIGILLFQTGAASASQRRRVLAAEEAARMVGGREAGAMRERGEAGSVCLAGVWVPSGDAPLLPHVHAFLLVAKQLFPTPPPRPHRPGPAVPSSSKLSRDHKIALAQVLHASTLALSPAAEYVRMHIDSSFPHVDNTTLGRAAHDFGVAYGSDSRFDPKEARGMARKREALAFSAEKERGVGGQLRGENLLFLDESNFHLNLDELSGARSWGLGSGGGSKVGVRKGKTLYVSVTAAIGIVGRPGGGGGGSARPRDDADERENYLQKWAESRALAERRGERIGGWNVLPFRRNEETNFLLMWRIIPPSRKAALRPVFDSPEEELSPHEMQDFKKIKQAISRSTVSEFLKKVENGDSKTVKDAKAYLFQLGVDDREVVDLSIAEGGGGRGEQRRGVVGTETASNEELARRFEKVFGGDAPRRAGLPRRFIGTAYTGGGPASELSTTSKFLVHLRSLAAYIGAFYGKDVLSDTRVLLDNASTHGRVDVDSQAASFLHEYGTSRLGFGGMLFTPVRTPKENAVEVLFSFLKSVLRTQPLPPGGEFGAPEMVAHVEDAMQRVTPAMGAAWIASRGYRLPAQTLALYTRPVRAEGGGTAFATEGVGSDFRADSTLSSEAVPIAGPSGQAGAGAGAPSKEERERVEGFLKPEREKAEEVLRRAVWLRAGEKGPSGAGSLDASVARLFKDAEEALPMYGLSFRAVRQDDSLDDRLLLLQCILSHRLRALSRLSARAASGALAEVALSSRSLCASHGVGCPSSSSREAAPLCVEKFGTSVCVGERGEVVASARADEARSSPHLRLTVLGDRLERVLSAVAAEVANGKPANGAKEDVERLRTDLSDVAKDALHSGGGQSDDPSLRRALRFLRPFLSHVASRMANGLLRPEPPPCAVLSKPDFALNMTHKEKVVRVVQKGSAAGGGLDLGFDGRDDLPIQISAHTRLGDGRYRVKALPEGSEAENLIVGRGNKVRLVPMDDGAGGGSVPPPLLVGPVRVLVRDWNGWRSIAAEKGARRRPRLQRESGTENNVFLLKSDFNTFLDANVAGEMELDVSAGSGGGVDKGEAQLFHSYRHFGNNASRAFAALRRIFVQKCAEGEAGKEKGEGGAETMMTLEGVRTHFPDAKIGEVGREGGGGGVVRRGGTDSARRPLPLFAVQQLGPHLLSLAERALAAEKGGQAATLPKDAPLPPELSHLSPAWKEYLAAARSQAEAGSLFPKARRAGGGGGGGSGGEEEEDEEGEEGEAFCAAAGREAGVRKGSRKCALLTRLRRLLLEMTFSAFVLASASDLRDVSLPARVPFFSIAEARRRGSRFFDADEESGASNGRRWPGYPFSPYHVSLAAIRDAAFRGAAGGGAAEPVGEAADAAFVLRRHGDIARKLVFVYAEKGINTIDIRVATQDQHFKKDLSKWEDRDKQHWKKFIEKHLGAPEPILDASDGDDILYPAVLVNAHGETFDEEKEKRLIDAYGAAGQKTKSKENIAQWRGAASKLGPTQWYVCFLEGMTGGVRGVIGQGAAVHAKDIYLHKSLSAVERRLRVGMPWSFAASTDLHPTPHLYLDPLQIYFFDDVPVHLALSTLREYYIGVQDAPPDETRAFFRDANATLDKALAFATSKDLHPKSISDLMDNYVILVSKADSEASDGSGGGGAGGQDTLKTVETVAAIEDGDDHVMKALLQVARQRRNQRRRRESAPPKASPSAKSKPATQAGADALSLSEATAERWNAYYYHLTDPKGKQNRVASDYFAEEKGGGTKEGGGVYRVRLGEPKRTLYPVPKDAVPAPLHRSKKGHLRAYGADVFGSFDAAAKAVQTMVAIPSSAEAVILYKKRIWTASRLGGGQKVVVIRRSASSAETYVPLFFVDLDAGRDADLKTTQWTISLSDLKERFGFPISQPEST